MPALVLLALLGGGRSAASSGLLAGEIAAGGERVPYLLYVPRDYARAKRWPLVLFLHGSGESGTDGWRQLLQGLPPALFDAPQRWPAVILMPQKPDPEREWESYEPALMKLVERTRQGYSIDPDRILLTGLSQGGHGSWVLGARHADLWAAVAPVCGYAKALPRDSDGALPRDAFLGTAADLAPALAHLPVWAYHGAIDDVVPVAETEGMIAALAAAGNPARMTIVPDVGHGVWATAYENPEFAAWLFAQRRPPAARKPGSRPRRATPRTARGSR
jgi:predicted peptidase